ncbi:hypothetical protein WKV44_01390 [Spirochaetia bacterium 38H-sp]|uniref:Uncharacterized protein n=1 Tax=Rarispira pelagica TaxID=3141764 RepID=A0ABU9U937_9SPIR
MAKKLVFAGMFFFILLSVYAQSFSGSVFSSFSYKSVDKSFESVMGMESLSSSYGTKLVFYSGDDAGKAYMRMGVFLSLQEDYKLVYSWELYEAFVSVSAGDFLRFYAGRQVLPLGVCYSIHPVDSIHRISGDESVGRDGLSVRWAAGADYSGALMVLTDVVYGLSSNIISGLGYAGYVDGFFMDSVEIGLSGIWLDSDDERFGGWFSFPLGVFVFSSEFAWDKGEDAWCYMLSSEWDWYGEWSSLVLITELFYQQDKLFTDYARYFSVISHTDWTIWDRYVLEESLVWEADSKSAIITIGLGFLPGNKTDCRVGFSLPVGKDGSFYGLWPYDFIADLKFTVSY